MPALAPALPLASVPLGGRLASGFRGNTAAPALACPTCRHRCRLRDYGKPRTTDEGCPSRSNKGTRRTMDECMEGNRCRLSPRAPAPMDLIRPLQGISTGQLVRGWRCWHRAVLSRGALGSGQKLEGSGCGALSSSSGGRWVTSDLLALKLRTISHTGFAAEVLLLVFVIFLP